MGLMVWNFAEFSVLNSSATRPIRQHNAFCMVVSGQCDDLLHGVLDFATGWLTESVLLGCPDARLADLGLSEEGSMLVELGLGSSREPASSLWRKMKEYAISRGEEEQVFT